MVKKTISELPLVVNQKSTALIPLEQGGITSNSSVRPNPPRQRNYTSEAQLTTDFPGSVIDSDVTIFIDETFTLSQPIKIQGGVNLEIKSGVGGVILIYTGSGLGPVIQNETASTIAGLKITDVDFADFTADTNTFIDVTTGANQSVFLEGVNLFDFKDLGSMEATLVLIQNVAAVDHTIGFKIKNYTLARISNLATIQTDGTPSGFNPTLLSFIALTATRSQVILNNITLQDAFDGDSLVFFDPNAEATSAYEITESSVTPVATNNFYQQGADIAILASQVVGPSGAGFTQFTTDGTLHGLQVGKAIVHSGFAGEPTYNGTFIVTDIISTTVYEVEVTLGATSTGTLNAASLNSTDPLVNAFNNPGEEDSMSQAEERTGDTIPVVIITAGIFQDIVKATPVPGDFIQDVATERFTIDDETGLITYNGLEPLTVRISYQLDIIKTSGGGSNAYAVIIVQNTTEITKSLVQTGDISTSLASTPIYIGGILSINPNDTLKLQVRSNSGEGTSPVSISNLTFLITEA